jgi:type IV pilus assembly protein PilY1
VVGFNVNTIADTTPVDCTTLAASPTQFAAICADPTKQALYGSCCSLEKIAFSGSGGTQSAFFVKTQDDLLNALNVIISKIAKNTTARTVPSYSPNVATVNNDPNTPITNGSVYLASFQPLVGQTWSGDVTRQRYVCDASQNLTQPTPDPTQGDDFSKNLNAGAGGPYAARQFSVIQPATVSGVTDATATIRPFATGSDGLGSYGGTIVAPTDATTAIATLTPTALQITNTSCPNLTNTEFLTADSCKKLAMNFAVASATTDAMPDATFSPFTSRVGNAFGDIFHATPTVIGPPNAVIRDGTYEAFAATYAQRPTVLYAATNDGMLHAFNTGVAAQQNNEMWAMFPPGVLPKLLSVYPAGHALMLDGPPVVKDVVFDRTQAQIGDPTRWHTMLVAGYGSGAQGYFGVDITDPDERTPVVAGGSPQFRWQLTSVPNSTKQIFGQHSATPAITTVFADLGDGSGAHEIGVAILPGGTDGSPTTNTPCTRDTDTSDAPLSSASLASPPNNTFPARTQVQCWSGNGRSVSVVRLDTGEIIRTFMRTSDAPAAIVSSGKLRATPLDSPMTGVPIVYPTDVGAIAQRAYVGDADGTMWRFDLSSQSPDSWMGSLFVDAYNTDPNVVTATPWQDGQPIAVPPTVAIDDVGNVVVSFATGDQETYTATGTNFVYSVTEKLSTTSGVSSLRGNVNWFLRFINGQRVSGPMAVFDETLYFATFAAPANTAVCTLGAPALYGRDFEIPKDPSTLSLGGLPRLNPNNVQPIPDFVDPTNGSSSSPFAGKIIPGVSINITPTCSNTAVGVNDSYVPGATHYLAQNVNAGSPSLFAQVGGQNASGQPLSVSVSLPRPATVTSVDSWAAVVE